MSVSDNEIIERIRSGEKRLYAHLIDRYKDRAFTLAIRILRDRQEAEEATQDAFIRAYNALNTFEGRARFGTWFYRILYNLCLTRLGKKKDGFLHLDYNDNKEYDTFQYSFTSDEFNEYELKDMVEFLKRTIETLPVKYQTIISLFYFQEMSHEEICHTTQLPLGTVKTHLYRARAMLQRSLQKELQIEKAV